MKVLLTGSNGVVGKSMCRYLNSISVDIIQWDRNKVSPCDFDEMNSFIEIIKPDAIFHFAAITNQSIAEKNSWEINVEWPAMLAKLTKKYKIKFLFTSTSMIFNADTNGPFQIDAFPNAVEGYGFEKRKAEEAILQENSEAYIVRLGWQIGDDFVGNNMLAYLENENKCHSKIKASNKWYPACSFVFDTVQEMYRIACDEKSGIYMIDSNDGYSFFEIVNLLKKEYKKSWNIVLDDSFISQQRMLDTRVKIKKLSEYFMNKNGAVNFFWLNRIIQYFK